MISIFENIALNPLVEAINVFVVSFIIYKNGLMAGNIIVSANR